MANDYATLANVKAELPDAQWGSSYDTLVPTLITHVSRQIDIYTGRKPGAFNVGSTSETRYYDAPLSTNQLSLWIDEITAAPTTVAVAQGGVIDSSAGTGGTYTAWAAADYLLWPYNAALEGRPYLRLDIDALNGTKGSWYGFRKGVKVTGVFGFATTTPDYINRATIVGAVRIFSRNKQMFADTSAIVQLGQLMYTKKLDPEVQLILDSNLRRIQF